MAPSTWAKVRDRLAASLPLFIRKKANALATPSKAEAALWLTPLMYNPSNNKEGWSCESDELVGRSCVLS